MTHRYTLSGIGRHFRLREAIDGMHAMRAMSVTISKIIMRVNEKTSG
jgi:hypothetical protein